MSITATPDPDHFQNALECWKQSGNPDAISHLLTYWFAGEPTVLVYSRARRGNLQQEEIQEIQQLLPLLESDYASDRAHDLLQGATDLGGAPRQMVTLVQGMLHGLLAAHFTSGWQPTSGKPLPDEAIRALTGCLSKYHEAWDLLTPSIKAPVNAAGSHSHPDRSVAILDQFGQQVRPSADWWNDSNWLLVRRLLSYLHGDVDGSLTGYENHAQALLVVEDDERGFHGRPLPVIVAECDEGRTSAYLDPVALGITPMDDQMRRSLQIAARICRSRLESNPGESSRSVRISMDPHQCEVMALEGASAGGLVTAAAYATASRRRLNRDCTASFTVGVRDDAWMQDRDHMLLDAQVLLDRVGPESLYAKLTCVRDPLHMKTVFLHGSQELGSRDPGAWNAPPTRLKWTDWAARLERELNIHIEPIGRASESEADSNPSARTLADVIEAMTGDERIEAVLIKYSNSVAKHWAAQRADEDDVDYLKHYICPSFEKKVRDGAVLDRTEIDSLRRQGATIPEPYEPISPPTADEDSRFRDLFSLGRRLIITEDAGAGKSVFTRRGVAWCSEPAGQKQLFQRRPGLALRFERVDADWPGSLAGYREAMLQAVEPFCDGTTTASQVVDYALKQGRVIIFCDALDQLSGQDSDHKRLGFFQMAADMKARFPENRIVVTSRAFAYENLKQRFPTREWTLCRLSGFSAANQLQYLADLIDAISWQSESRAMRWRAWRTEGILPELHRERRSQTTEEFATEILDSPELFDSLYRTICELLKVPAILAFVRTLCGQENRFPRFSNRADLYFQANDFLLDRNLEKREELAWEIRQRKAELREILTAVAFQMMVNDSQNYVVQGEAAVENLQGDVQKLISNPAIRADWNHLWRLVEQLAGFTSHLVVERKSHDYFGWKHRGMMEFYCGLFLARNTCASWPLVQRNGRNIPLISLLADPQWEWAVQFAHEVTQAQDPNARKWHSSEVYFHTMASLFDSPQDHARPTKHMYLAWQLLKSDPKRFPGLHTILANCRQQFLDILAGNDQGRARLAAELLLEQDVRSFVDEGKTGVWSFEDLRPKAEDAPAYSLCCDPDNQQRLSFMMGASPEDSNAYDDEKPWQPVEVDSFYMATACVTRAQYQLFDPNREKLHTQGNYPIAKIAPEPDCPMIYVDFFDAACFALWLGERYRLPNEVQWEGAAWGGLDRTSLEHRQTVIGVEPYNESFTSDQVNFDGNYPMAGEKSSYLEGTLPVRWDAARREEFLRENPGEQVPKAYVPNRMKLWQMSGNIWEWCHMRWFESLTDAIQHQDTEIDSRHNVCFRGGSWDDGARDCRCSNRFRFAPGYRYFILGFRLLRTSS